MMVDDGQAPWNRAICNYHNGVGRWVDYMGVSNVTRGPCWAKSAIQTDIRNHLANYNIFSYHDVKFYVIYTAPDETRNHSIGAH